MPVHRTSRDPIFRTWNIVIFSVALVLLALFSIQLSVHSTAAAETLRAGETGVIVTDGRRLNARSGPGTNFAIVGKIEPDTSVQILDASADGQWLNISLTGATDNPANISDVWVSSEYVTTSTNASRPQTAAPTATSRAAQSTPAGVTQLNLNRTTTTASTTAATTAPTMAPTTAPAAAATTVATTAPTSANTAIQNQQIDLLASLLPTVTPTPVRDDESTNGENNRTTARVAPINLQALTSRVGSTSDSQTSGDTATTAQTNPTTAAAPVATATPEPTPSVATAFTQPARMNVRGGPGTNFQIVTSVPAGTGLEILASNPAGDWYQVNMSGHSEAWIFASLTQARGPLDTIARLTEDQLPQPPAPPEPVAAEPAGQMIAASQTSPAAAPAAAPVVSAPAPTGGGPFGYGVQAHMLGGGGDRSLEAVNDLGFNWIKQQVQWKLFEPSPGGRQFGELQGIVNAAGGRGINVLFSVVDAPDWAREGGFDGSVGGPPADPQTYAAFLGAMAGTFCGSSLKAIEVWNEQNLHYEWGNRPLNPAEYMNLLRPAYAAIKAACPSMYVISGALTPAGNNLPYAMDDFAYLEAMYQNGLANYADGIGAHPSGYNVPPSVTWQDACGAIQTHGNSFNGACDSPHHSWSFRSTMEGYRNIMVTYGDANKKIWPTEFGWAAGGAFDPRYAYANDNSFEEQAAWTVEAYQMMKAWGWVGPAILWNLNFRVVADGTEKAQWGIVSNNWEPLPIYHALKAMPK